MTDLPSLEEARMMVHLDMVPEPLRSGSLMSETLWPLLTAYADGGLRDVSAIRRVECSDHVVTAKFGTTRHLRCDGRGWLYPDPPAWWLGDEGVGAAPWDIDGISWEMYCDRTWRLFEMYEYGEADDET